VKISRYLPFFNFYFLVFFFHHRSMYRNSIISLRWIIKHTCTHLWDLIITVYHFNDQVNHTKCDLIFQNQSLIIALSCLACSDYMSNDFPHRARQRFRASSGVKKRRNRTVWLERFEKVMAARTRSWVSAKPGKKMVWKIWLRVWKWPKIQKLVSKSSRIYGPVWGIYNLLVLSKS